MLLNEEYEKIKNQTNMLTGLLQEANVNAIPVTTQEVEHEGVPVQFYTKSVGKEIGFLADGSLEESLITLYEAARNEIIEEMQQNNKTTVYVYGWHIHKLYPQTSQQKMGMKVRLAIV